MRFFVDLFLAKFGIFMFFLLFILIVWLFIGYIPNHLLPTCSASVC